MPLETRQCKKEAAMRTTEKVLQNGRATVTHPVYLQLSFPARFTRHARPKKRSSQVGLAEILLSTLFCGPTVAVWDSCSVVVAGRPFAICAKEEAGLGETRFSPIPCRILRPTKRFSLADAETTLLDFCFLHVVVGSRLW